MRLLFTITSLLPGGAETLVTDLAIRLKAMDVDVEVAVFNAVETPLLKFLIDNGITVHRFYPNGCTPYHPGNIIKLRRLIKSKNYDIIHSHNTAAQLFTAIAAPQSARIEGSKPPTWGVGGLTPPLGGSGGLITTEHNTTNRRRGNPLLRLVDRWMYRQYDRIVCISEATAKNLVDFVGKSVEGQLEIISNGIDLKAFTNKVRPINPDGDVIVTMVAGFRKQKDQDTLLKAIALLPERFKLRLVGDGDRRQILESLVASLGIGDRVEFLGFRSDVPDVLASSDIVVLSSHYEGLSLSSVEAMASGRAFVASDVPGLHEVVDGYGLLFPEGDAEMLATLLRRLADDPEMYKKTALACQSRSGQFDINKTTSRYYQLYGTSPPAPHVGGSPS